MDSNILITLRVLKIHNIAEELLLPVLLVFVLCMAALLRMRITKHRTNRRLVGLSIAFLVLVFSDFIIVARTSQFESPFKPLARVLLPDWLLDYLLRLAV